MDTINNWIHEHSKAWSSWPWAYYNDPVRQWREHPSFVICEFTFITLSLCSFIHAFDIFDGFCSKRNKIRSPSPGELSISMQEEKGVKSVEARKKWLFIASFVVGFSNDYFFMLLPVVDNFWQAQGVIMLTPRMPIYIVCVYNAMLYWPVLGAERIFGPLASPPRVGYESLRRPSRFAEASLAGWLCGVLYAIYDVCGARFLWWTWHNDDGPIKERWLGVPAGSTMFCVLLPFSMCFLRRTALDWEYENGKTLGFLCLFSTLFMVMLINTFILCATPSDPGTPSMKSVGVMGIFIIAGNVWGFIKPTVSKAPKSPPLSPIRKASKPMTSSNPGSPALSPVPPLSPPLNPSENRNIAAKSPCSVPKPMPVNRICSHDTELSSLTDVDSKKGAKGDAGRRQKRHPLIFFAFVCYFSAFVVVMYKFKPEESFSTGVHQTYGHCDISDIDLYGNPRKRYNCDEDYPKWYFKFNCDQHQFEHSQDVAYSEDTSRWSRVHPVKSLNKMVKMSAGSSAVRREDEVVTWYTICGQPHEDFKRWLVVVAALASIGIGSFGFAFCGGGKITKRINGDSSPRRNPRNGMLNKWMRRQIDRYTMPLLEFNFHLGCIILLAFFFSSLFVMGWMHSAFLYWLRTKVIGEELWHIDQGILQGPYDFLLDNIGRDTLNNPMFVPQLFGMVYLGLLIFYTTIDCIRPGGQALKKLYMLQPRAAFDFGIGYFRTLYQQVCGFAPWVPVMIFMGTYLDGPAPYMYPWLPRGSSGSKITDGHGGEVEKIFCLKNCSDNKNLPDKAPPLIEFLFHVFFCLWGHDILYFIFHWCEHRNTVLYNRVHKVHHEYTAPFATVGAHLHPYESIFVSFMGMYSPLATYSHPMTAWFGGIVGTFAGVEAHSGYYWNPLSLIMKTVTLNHKLGWGGTKHHDVHHQKPWCNFEPYFGYLDYLFGTGADQDPNEGEERDNFMREAGVGGGKKSM